MASPADRRNLITIVLGFAAGIGCGGIIGYYAAGYIDAQPQQRRGDGGESAPAPTRVAARGRLEPEGGVINVAAPGPDLLQKIKVQEGQLVNKDQELAVLGSARMRRIEQDLARAQLDEAEDRRQKSVKHLLAQQKESRAHIEMLQKQGPLDLQIQDAKIQVLRRQLATAADLVERMRKAGTYTKQELDQQQLLRDQAQQELNGAGAALDKIKDANAAALRDAEAQRDVIDADLERAQSQLQVASLQKGLELSGERLAQTVVRAPVKGRVLKILGHEGELVGAAPLFQIADVGSMVAVAEVYETDVKAVREWFRGTKRVVAEVEIRFPGAAPTRFRGQVIHVADMVAKNTAFSVDPRQDVDRRVVEVRIRIDPASQREAAEYINMQVDVTILDPQSSGSG
jgi:HlyD family secretion protein